MREIRNACKILIGKHEGKVHSEHIGVDGKIILEWMLRKWMERFGLDASD
jgi:hypothetical protein